MGATIDDLVREVRRLATEKPENVYLGRFSYVSGECSDGSVGCIVGQAFRAIGIDPAKYDSFCGQGIAANAGRAAADAFAISDIDIRCSKAHWLRSVQGSQDRGDTWSAAVAFADSRNPPRSLPGE